MSICREVTPFSVPQTLKSMSPAWSSSPRMSERMTTRSPSFSSPIAIPATVSRIGTPASISDRQPPQTVAIDEDPLEERMSDTTRIV